MKNKGFFPWQTALKLCSSLFLPTFLFRNMHVPLASHCPVQSPCPAPNPGQVLPTCFCPVLSGTFNWIFPSAPFLFRAYSSFPWRERCEGKGKIMCIRRKLTHCIAAALPAAQRWTERCAQASCWAAAFCMFKMLHKSLQLSQISMRTLTVTPSCGSFGFFHITFSRSRFCCTVQRLDEAYSFQATAPTHLVQMRGCCGLKEEAWMLLMQHSRECCWCVPVNVNIAIAQR